jgi:DNA-nicking Smr family endonuclease
MPPKGRPPKPPKPPKPKTGAPELREPQRTSKLSEEERALWDSVTRDTEPLRKRPRKTTPETPAESETPKSKPAKPRVRTPVPAIAPARKPKPAPPTLGHGDIADLDKRSAERMRRGQLPIEATLDLHGHSQDAARRELADFLARAQSAGKRCVIIVTGKGDIARGSGVLRAQVPRWLNEAENRARVLAFDYAQPRHGGLGALYVLLRKTRETR